MSNLGKKTWTEMEGVVFVHKNQPKIYSLHTTRSWEFVGLDTPLNPWKENSDQKNGDLLSRAQYGKDIIVGMIDSGKFYLPYMSML